MITGRKQNTIHNFCVVGQCGGDIFILCNPVLDLQGPISRHRSTRARQRAATQILWGRFPLRLYHPDAESKRPPRNRAQKNSRNQVVHVDHNHNSKQGAIARPSQRPRHQSGCQPVPNRTENRGTEYGRKGVKREGDRGVNRGKLKVWIT